MHFTTSLSSSNGKFLGSCDRIIIAGNSPDTKFESIYVHSRNYFLLFKCFKIRVQIFHYGLENSLAQHQSNFKKTSEINLGEKFKDIELCGVPRLARSTILLSNTGITA
jgi:hypothetical protein